MKPASKKAGFLFVITIKNKKKYEPNFNTLMKHLLRRTLQHIVQY